jgi:hypothetical protein
VIWSWILQHTAPWWIRDIHHRERALQTLADIWERDHRETQ